MRSILLTISMAIAFAVNVQAQDESGIALNVIVPKQGDEFNAHALTTVQSKLEQIAAHYGLAGANFNPHFVLVPQLLVEEHKRTGTAPPRTLMKLNVILKIANAQSKTVFTTISLTASGVGDSKREAIAEALNSMNTNNEELKAFIKEGKQEIMNYYNQQCDELIAKAESRASAEQFKVALSYLYRIPSSADCHDKAMEKVSSIFEQYQQKKCNQLLAAAEAAYGAGKMDTAAQYMALVPSNSECQEKVKELAAEMKEERMKKYEDKAEIEKLKAKAARDIAMEWAKNQPNEKVDIRFLKGGE